MSKEHPFGIDISRYQWTKDLSRGPDFEKVREKTDFVAVRAGIAKHYEDPIFEQAWKALVGTNRIAYHVLHPTVNGVEQANWLLDIVERAGVDYKHDRLAIDLELDMGQTRAKITEETLAMMERLRSVTGRYPILYSRAQWVDLFMNINDVLARADWWLAHYLSRRPYPDYTPEKIPPPAIPKGVKRWLVHQTGERGRGADFDSASHYIDTNRWNSEAMDINEYFGRGEGKSDDPPVNPPVSEPLFRVEITTQKGYRYITYGGPNMNRLPDSKWLHSGDIEPVFDTVGHWYRISGGRWINGSYKQWVKVLEEAPTFVYFGPVYNQRDIRWKDVVLGTKSTIGENGCLLASVSMALNALGIESNPKKLNEQMKGVGGFMSGNLFIWEKVQEVYPSVKFNGHVHSPTYQQMKEATIAGSLPLIYVDFNNNTPEIEMHWVIGIGYDATDILCADPWTGDIFKLRERYRNNVIRFGSYSMKE